MNYYDKGTILVCVDPGLRGCGMAVFDSGELFRAGYVVNPVLSGNGYTAHEAMGWEALVWLRNNSSEGAFFDKLLIEHPRVYPGSAQQKGDPNDLLDVVAVGASVATALTDISLGSALETVYPFDWKGNAPKEVMTARIRAALSPEERAKILPCAAGLMHNVLDACGIGLWRLRRINQKKIHND